MTSRIRVILGALTGGYMLVDGIFATQTGSYIGNAIGPWSILVGALGIHPRSYFMWNAFIIYGICWLAALAFYLARRRVALGVMAAATLWYLPVGTLFSAIILGTYLFRRKS